MGASSVARRAARRGLSWLPAGARARALGRLGPAVGGRLGLSGAGVGLVSLVVVCETADEQRLADCLASLRAQWHSLLDVLVCPVGEASIGTAGSDPRFRMLPAQPTWYDAANAGAGRARGVYLGFVRACDTMPAHAVTDLAGSLAGSGSDVAVGRLTQLGLPEAWLERVQRCAHGEAASGLLPDVDPALVGDLAIGNKLVRLDFWRSAGAQFDRDDEWLTAPTWARVFVLGPRTDIVDVPVVRHAHDHGARPFGALPSPLPELSGWARRSRLVEQALEGSPLARGWLMHVLDVALPRFLLDAERADEQQWRDLVDLASSWRSRDEEVLGEARAESRALIWLAVQEARADLEALAEEVDGRGEELATTLVGDEVFAVWRSVADRLPPEVVRLTEAETRLIASVQRCFVDETELVADVFVRVRHLDLGSTDAEISVQLADGTPLPVERRPDPTANRWAQSPFQSAGEGSVRLRLPHRTGHDRPTVEIRLRAGELERQGQVVLSVPTRVPSAGGALPIDAVHLDGDEIVVRSPGPAAGLRVVGEGLDLTGRPGAEGETRFSTASDLFGRPVRLPSGRYVLTHPAGVRAATALCDALPHESLGRWHRLRVLGEGGDSFALHLGPPLADDELGPYGQQRLRAAYANADGPTDPDLFYFESYAGGSATDSPLAILAELLTRRPEVRARWGVLDHGQWVPEGAEPVVLRSREWYDVLARARVLVTNTELEEWHVRRLDQLVVQTFHGYPSKAMGRSQWQARQLPPRRVRVMRARSVDTWDLILTPSPEMTRHYREQYSYTGAVHERGYPRDDALRGQDVDEVRRTTRAMLRIADDQTAVLYAPTWRDHLATRPRAAAMADHLDVERAARRLGDGHVLLVRGHRFHGVPTGGGPAGTTRSARVVDVTGHPEINDLVLASDVAVLDYSSLRFDYAQSGRPMVFLVPDLEEYTDGVRGFLFPFEDSAPGPFVRDTDEVVEQVRDVAALGARWAKELREFDMSYNAWQDGQASRRVVDRLLGML